MRQSSIILYISFVLASIACRTFGFSLLQDPRPQRLGWPTTVRRQPKRSRAADGSQTFFLQFSSGNSNLDDSKDATTASSTCWSPELRKIMGVLASLGVVETSYLTISKWQGQVPLCPTTTDAAAAATTCSSVLTGPYAQIPGTDVPLAALGWLAYSATLVLAVGPLLSRRLLLLPAQEVPSLERQNNNNDDDTTNRILLTAVTTSMGVFSAFLLSLLFGVLHESCGYCVASAILSLLLAQVAWLGGALPPSDRTLGVSWSVAGAGLSLLAALTLFFSNEPPEPFLAEIGSRAGASTLLLASNSNSKGSSSESTAASTPPYAPPAITTTSSPQALQLADELRALDASFYGAFWCSHCYDQKQALGQQAMAKIPYVECSRDGAQANAALCASKKVPGYPTWEIAGQLYPGQQALEELQDIVAQVKQQGKNADRP